MNLSCESCGMAIANSRYCAYCVDADGHLQGFEQRFARMVQWARGEDPALSVAQAEQNTLAYMARMPAWADHPRVRARAQAGAG